MKSYDIPETDFLTAEQASAAVRRMSADCQSDPEHPFLNRNHAQHADFVGVSTRLHTVIATAEADRQDVAEREKLDAETQGLSPAECLAKGRALLKTEGYLSGEMPLDEHAELKRQIDLLYLAGSQEPETFEENPDA
jgi:hypothetical protein